MEPRHLLTTFVVDSLEDNTNADGMVTLREAIQAAEMDLAVGDAVAGSGADTITFAPGLQGTINLSTVGDSSSGDSAFSISTQITIDGSNGGTGITLDAGGNKRHFLVTGAGNLTLDTLTLERGSAESGGAINNAGTLSISSSTLFNNTAGVTFSGIGGAINNDGGSIVVDNSTFSGNTAVTQPGNVGAGAGGAIYNSNGDFRATSTTFTGNTASRGGALFTSVFGQVRTVSLENSILANSSGDDLENFGGTVDARYSLIESGLGPGASGVNGVNVGNIFGLDPGLEFLGNTGGPTQTHRLAPNSPAVNAGDPAAASGVGGIPNFDQRGNGFGRVVEGRIDMGATELQGPKLVSLTRQNPTAQFTAADTLTFRAEFDSEVVNVDATDFTVAGGSTTIVSGVLMLSESMYDITVSGGDLAGFNGTVGLDVASGTDIDDLNGFSLLPVEPPTDETYGLANQSTVTVSTLADGIDGDFSAGQLSLREAVAFANTLPTVTTINFDGGLNGGTITLGSQLVLTDSVTIAGPGADQLTISGGEATRLFFLASGRTATIDDLTLADGNAVGEQGGVITFVGSTVNFNRVLMTGNTSLNGGNTIEAAFGILNITDSALVNNRGVLAAIRSQDNQLTITNTTISNNASAGIRAISAFAAPDSLTLENVTIADNSGTGVALVTVGGALPMMIYSNTIVANNGGDGSFSVAGGQSPSVPITSQGYNLLSDTPSGDAAHAAALGDLRNTDPLLGPLQDNGGPTPTHALLPGSPAIDAGNSTLTTDQRGLTRSADLDSVANAAGGNGSDIGAFEVQAEPSSLTVTTTADVVDNTDMLTSLREAIMFANSTPGADTIGFDAGVFTGGAASVIRLSGTELSITESLVIDGLTGTDVLVTADSAGDDTLVAGTFITDAIANTNTADNSRVLNFTGSAGDLTLRGLTVTGGGVAGGGGGIRFGGSVFSGTLLIDQSTVSGNRTTGDGAYGGGIYTSSGAVTLTSSTVSGNRTTGNFSDGGGVFTRTGAVSLTSSSVSGNRTAGDVAYGGGIYTSSGAVTLTGSTVSGNQSSGLGGGFQTLTGAVTLTSSTVSGNQSGGSGGGIYTFDSPVLIQSSTITGNQALGVGGGIGLLADNFDDDERLTILNSIVAGNSDNGTAPDFLAPGDPANDLTVGFSLIGDNTGTTLAEAQTADAAGNLIGSPTGGGLIDPLLGPLADNGGP
ncbi:MAG: choice-of-anchor Q domain-containing protein, partial [Planctomycetota bacterium]